MKRFLLVALSLAFAPVTLATLDPAGLKPGQQVSGFRVTSVYLNDADVPVGARFLHVKTGHTLDLLQIESVPQAYTWVNSFPVSDQGEPHTQEHLLLLKGIRGRTLSTRQTMSLAGHSAFTQQWRTSYIFNTAAGTDVFFDLYAEQLRAMLHPNYSDSEIRGEVRNFGVTANPDGTLRLEEKGTVYNEMVSSDANPTRRAFSAALRLEYGDKHPLAMNAGGAPEAIRTMKPEDIRKFHRNTHYLANMGTIAALPKSEALDDALKRFDQILMKDAPAGAPRRAQTLDQLPPPRSAPAGTIQFTEYPQRNEQQPSPLALWWPPVRKLDANEQLLAELFMASFAGDATTNVYKLLIDGRTRKLDLGARSVFSSMERNGGHPAYIFVTDVAPANFTGEKAAAIRTLVVDELQRIAALPDDSAELKAFNERVLGRVVGLERDLAKFVGTPPGFGFRGGGSQWMDHLLLLERTSGSTKSLTMKPEIRFVRTLLASDRNVWREYLAKWQLTGVTPYVVAARPSPGMVKRDDEERVDRIAEETERLKRKYAAADAQVAIRRYAREMEAEVARTEEEAKKVPRSGFVKTPPMTLDDELRYEVKRLANGVPLVASRFENMSGAMTGIALRVNGIPRDELRYLSLMPALLTRVGVIEDGRPIPFEEMTERLRKEILSLDAGFSTNPRTGRVELVVRGAGIGVSESRRAIEWMMLVLNSPDWRPENLARIRDLVDQSLGALRNTMQGSEESWVNNPANAYRMQRDPAWLAADSFLTRTHNALRLRWQLKDGAPADKEAVAAFFTQLAEAGRTLSRNDLKVLLMPAKAPGLEALSPSARAIATEALKDLDLSLIEIPDGSLGGDFSYLALALRDDWLTPPATALARLDAVRKRLLVAGGARLFTAGSDAMGKEISARLEGLVGKLGPGPLAAVEYGSTPLVVARLQMRDGSSTPPRYVGLYSPNKQGGVIITSVPSVHYADATDKEKQLDYLASRLYSGGGTHGIFLKTLAAGLAYSNGLRGSISSGQVGYYAERTPELPQTVRFVVNDLKTAKVDPSLGEYVMTQAFGEFRSAATYESRAEGIAADLADNQPAEQVRKFRESMLELRKDPKLGEALFSRKDKVYARMLPGYQPGAEAPDGLYFAIGPDKQLDAWNEYLRTAAGGARLSKLYGRDFWMP